MSVASAVIEIRNGTGETALGRLAVIPQISVYGMKDNKIVAIIEGATFKIVDEAVKAILHLEEVVGVYPVYVTEVDSAP